MVAAVAIWAIVEAALLVRKARGGIDKLMDKAETTLTEVDGILESATTTIDDLQPTIKQLPSLLGKTEQAVDQLSADLSTADTILADVSVMTGTAMNATNAISRGASQATTAIGGAVAKVGKTISDKIAPKASKQAARIEAVEAKRMALEERASEIADSVGVELPPMQTDAKAADDGFFTYPDAPSEASGTEGTA